MEHSPPDQITRLNLDIVELLFNIPKLFSTDFRDRQESSDHHLVRWTVLIYRWGNSDTDRLHLLYVSKLNTNRVVVVVVVVLILFLLRLLSLLSCCLFLLFCCCCCFACSIGVVLMVVAFVVCLCLQVRLKFLYVSLPDNAHLHLFT